MFKLCFHEKNGKKYLVEKIVKTKLLHFHEKSNRKNRENKTASFTRKQNVKKYLVEKS